MFQRRWSSMLLCCCGLASLPGPSRPRLLGAVLSHSHLLALSHTTRTHIHTVYLSVSVSIPLCANYLLSMSGEVDRSQHVVEPSRRRAHPQQCCCGHRDQSVSQGRLPDDGCTHNYSAPELCPQDVCQCSGTHVYSRVVMVFELLLSLLMENQGYSLGSPLPFRLLSRSCWFLVCFAQLALAHIYTAAIYIYSLQPVRHAAAATQGDARKAVV